MSFLGQLQLNIKTDNLHDAGGYLVNTWSIFQVTELILPPQLAAEHRENHAQPEPDMT